MIAGVRLLPGPVASRPVSGIASPGPADDTGRGHRRRPSYGAASPRVLGRGSRTRQAILDGAIEVFEREGYHATRIEDIAAHAGRSRATVYQYFTGKEEIFRELATEVGAGLLATIRDRPPFGTDAAGAEALAQWLSDYRATFLRYRAVFAAWPQAMGADTALGGYGREFETSFLPRLAGQLERSGLIGLDGPTVALAVQSMSTCMWSREDTIAPVSPETVITELEGVLRRALFTGPDAQRGTTAAIRPRSPAAVGGPASRRDEVLQAAAVVIARQGLNATRIDDIVTEAGVSHGGFYLHFNDKSAVVRELADHWRDDVEGLVADLAELDVRRSRSALRRWLVRWVDSFRVHLAISRVWADGDALALDLQDHARAAARALSGVVEALMSDVGSAGDADARQVRTVAMVALLQDYPLQAVVYAPAVEHGAVVDTLDRMICRGLLTTDEPGSA